MSERTEVSFDAALMMALRADAQKELDELPTPAQLKERYPDTSRWDARLQAALHKRRPMLKRVLAAALTLVILTLGALAVSADFRKTVYTMIQKFLPIEMQVTYKVEGEPLERNRQISRRIKKHLWLSNRSWARDVHSFGILHSWGALAGKSCSAQASSIWLIAGAFRRTQSK